MLCCKLAVVVLLFVFIQSFESTRFHLDGKFICLGAINRRWCVTLRLMEADTYDDDIIIDWQTYCAKHTEVMDIALRGREDDDGMFDYNYEPYLIFKSTCNTTQLGEFIIDFDEVAVIKANAFLSVEVLLPNGIIRKSA